ncbi:Serine/threonine-protein kinase/endoribonuclease [Scale drop disease virus]|nr:Serine/threonine-protein kinase/endoribonuclease [Scale drop disease virus]QXJ13644.1 ORF056R [Scale drop disease virus]UNH60730.1 Serine/threonine-protein kinase/endoribonuclease [Scale drop disease virus]
MEQLIGRGSWGSSVYKVSEDVVSKRLLNCQYNTLTNGEPLSMYLTISHKNIVKYLYFYCNDNNFGYIGQEYCQYTLEDFVQNNELSFLFQQSLIKDVLCGLSLLHNYDPSIVHRHLTPYNVFVHNGVAKLSDYGLLKSPFDVSLTSNAHIRKRTKWIAREILIARDNNLPITYTKEADIQLAGMLTYYVLSKGRFPFEHTSIITDYYIYTGQYCIDSIGKDTHGYNLIKQMIDSNPLYRLNVDMCLKHPFFWTSVTIVQHVIKYQLGNNLISHN